VILEIADLVAGFCDVPEATARRLQVAFLKTTEPTFMVFADHQAHPLFVVKVGDAAILETRSALATRLYTLMPDAIARPVGVFRLDGNRALLVQEGLTGTPWFRLSDRCRTTADWRALRTRAVSMLKRFHVAVTTQPQWVAETPALDVELCTMTARLQEELAPLGERAVALFASIASDLAAVGPVHGVWQHGDFVLNNLLVDDDQMRVLDLDDFGKWRAPFVDAFALAHSVNLLASKHVQWHHLADDLAACATVEPHASDYTPRQKTAFFVYFLLAAMIDTLQKPTRATIRLTYLAALRDLLDDCSRYERAFAAPFDGV